MNTSIKNATELYTIKNNRFIQWGVHILDDAKTIHGKKPEDKPKKNLWKKPELHN